MGLLIGVGNTKPTFPYDYYYGVEWDITVSNPKPTRVGKVGNRSHFSDLRGNAFTTSCVHTSIFYVKNLNANLQYMFHSETRCG